MKIARPTPLPFPRWLVLLGLFALGAGCSDGGGPQSRQSIQFRVAAGPAAASSSVASGPLALTGVRLVLGPAALGKGDQFGCQDCTDNGPESATPASRRSFPPTAHRFPSPRNKCHRAGTAP